MLRELLKPLHPNARPQNGLLSRIASALARPWQTGYVAPSMRTVDAVLCAVRGYDVYWTPVGFTEEDKAKNKAARRDPSSVCYRIFKRTPATHNERVISHGVELPSLMPQSLYEIEHVVRSDLRRARARAHSFDFFALGEV